MIETKKNLILFIKKYAMYVKYYADHVAECGAIAFRKLSMS